MVKCSLKANLVAPDFWRYFNTGNMDRSSTCSSESPEGVRTDGWGRLLGSASQRAEAGRPPQSVMEEIRNFFRKRKAIALQKVHHTLSSCSSSHRPWSVALLWILSASEPCGFFPLGDSVLCVLFCVVVDSLCSDACECFIACHAHDAVPLVNAAQGSLCLCCARRLLASFLSDVVTC